VFARAVDNDETIKSALQGVVFLSIDCEKGEGPEIAKKYGVRGYPTFLMTNGEGTVTDGLIGYPGPEEWADFVTAGKADPRTIAEKQAAYEKEPTKALACALAGHAASSMDNTAAVKYYRAARELDPANAGHYTSEILTSMYYGSRGGEFTLDEVEAEAKVVLDNPDSDPEEIVNLAQMVRGMADGMGQVDRAIPYIKAGLKASEGVEELAKARQSLEIDSALLIEKDTDKAVALKRKSMPEGWQDDSGRLNQFAWWCFENKVNLDEAEEMALRGVELAPDDATRANILDTAAEICAARGDCSEAIARIKQAIELDPEKGYFKEQLARFEKQLAEKKG
jgi:tetratricopeptide (TPR) repeat protein